MKVTLNVSSFDASCPDQLLTNVAEQIVKTAHVQIMRQRNVVEYQQHKLRDMQELASWAEQRNRQGW